MVTSNDVARAAGVSRATVSRVLNGNDRVLPDARERVQRALAELGYVPNVAAKAMRTSITGAVGVVTSELLNPYVPRLLDAVTNEAKARGMTVLLWNDDDPSAPMAQRGIASGAVDGVMFTAARRSTTAAAEFARRGVPVVLANRAPDEIAVDSVSTDHAGVGRAAAEYLIRHGRTSIAAIFGPRDTYSSPARERAFRERLGQARLTVPAHHWIVGDTSYQHGWDAMLRILDRPPLPTALFCSADLIAFGAIGALNARGVRIPEDLWVIGNDGLPMAEWAPFNLTTFRQPIEEIARIAMDALLARIDNLDAPSVRIRLPATFITRASTNYSA